ncbi:MAG: RDD family protein [Mycobacterium sp.]
MTDQRPPPGSYPPPPGGYPPSPAGGSQSPQGGYPPQTGGSGAALPKESYTSWLTRVLAWVIDFIPVLIIEGIALGILMGTQETACVTDSSEFQMGEFCAAGASTLGQLAVSLAGIVILAYVVWNFGYRQGTTGSSIGKSIMKFKVLSEKTWQPIGFGLSIVRQLAHFIDAAICYIGYLFPLWDAKRQTIADKIMTTVCIPL